MACDEWLLENINHLEHPVLRIYGWAGPSVTIGYFQEFPQQLASKYKVIRRPTGGAVVFHDHDLTFTAVLPKHHPWKSLPTDERYLKIHERVKHIYIGKGFKASLDPTTQSLPNPSGRNLFSTECFVKPTRYDVIVEGIKVAGGAQRNTRNGLLHQGSILGTPKVSPEELIHAWESFGTSFQKIHLSEDQVAQINALTQTKYDLEVWNKKRSVRSDNLPLS